jgi:hypothetical protein
MADTTGFIAMGCDEILVHGWDATASERLHSTCGTRRAGCPQALPLGTDQ